MDLDFKTLEQANELKKKIDNAEKYLRYWENAFEIKASVKGPDFYFNTELHGDDFQMIKKSKVYYWRKELEKQRNLFKNL